MFLVKDALAVSDVVGVQRSWLLDDDSVTVRSPTEEVRVALSEFQYIPVCSTVSVVDLLMVAVTVSFLAGERVSLPVAVLLHRMLEETDFVADFVFLEALFGKVLLLVFDADKGPLGVPDGDVLEDRVRLRDTWMLADLLESEALELFDLLTGTEPLVVDRDFESNHWVPLLVPVQETVSDRVVRRDSVKEMLIVPRNTEPERDSDDTLLVLEIDCEHDQLVTLIVVVAEEDSLPAEALGPQLEVSVELDVRSSRLLELVRVAVALRVAPAVWLLRVTDFDRVMATETVRLNESEKEVVPLHSKESVRVSVSVAISRSVEVCVLLRLRTMDFESVIVAESVRNIESVSRVLLELFEGVPDTLTSPDTDSEVVAAAVALLNVSESLVDMDGKNVGLRVTVEDSVLLSDTVPVML